MNSEDHDLLQRIDERIAAINERVAVIDERVAVVEARTAVIEERTAVMDERVESIHKFVCGNGQPGLRQRVVSLEMWRSALAGGFALFMVALTVFGVTYRSDVDAIHRAAAIAQTTVK